MGILKLIFPYYFYTAIGNFKITLKKKYVTYLTSKFTRIWVDIICLHYPTTAHFRCIKYLPKASLNLLAIFNNCRFSIDLTYICLQDDFIHSANPEKFKCVYCKQSQKIHDI